jgi:hypothetical protein
MQNILVLGTILVYNPLFFLEAHGGLSGRQQCLFQNPVKNY